MTLSNCPCRISTLLKVIHCLVILVFANISRADTLFDWAEFDQILKQHVSTGTYQGVTANLVDYQALLNHQQFKGIAKSLSQYNPEGLSKKDKLTFYINAYNYFAIKIVVDNWPVKGIKDIGSLLRPVWKKTAGKINNREITLDEIEHKILRPMGEPRIHFAIVCSSMSCPDLRTEIYTAAKLDQQLDEQVRLFLSNTSKGAAIKGDKLHVSEIFEWFEEDFEATGVIGFIANYQPQLKTYSKFDTLEYNWMLNSKR